MFCLFSEFATLCETPNHDPGYCVEIKSCTRLLSQLNNSNARSFLRDSMCGPENEDLSNPKVCCGRYTNYRNVSKNIASLDVLPKNCGTQKLTLKSRVVGGKEAELGEFPWMARILHKNRYNFKSFGCSGFLIHSKYVITAAHCVHDKFLEVRGKVYAVHLGEHNIETEVDCMHGICADPPQVSRVAKVIVHPDYNPNERSQYNDIAILYLKKGMKVTNFIRPICLLEDPSQKPHKYIVSGWGKTEQDRVSAVKMKVDLPYIEKENCKQSYKALGMELIESQTCAGGEAGKDSCNGDSGGPLMMTTNGTVWFAAGIVSYGIGCGMENWAGVYSDIPSFIPWIKTVIVETNLLNPKSLLIARRKGGKLIKKNNDTESA
ncbi:unnamed protein product [Acanthoscelides obtectus]|uniref:CLIP domain-containing serine protease n=2 Tax=Acanthoscelides obtectus TaxID=200917 RepID=A0A9P0JNE4_ACAOB|nr:unnamed protein product [Acanthoscelides obtectus]CAK1678845.1 Phenoloxidase-activating factor 1 [Acanthoscelides obtectus]